ncbi:uncharacterized protein Triagg1_5075 [Trichoderma aggressivum f. europaeum]|uniref:Uncharacterized protein n=1 Tax=Trichoderma aggressivum f. europaeum TaxID=173218 RepID=A0AAE1LYT5_9HYPO|nr:hypothetical protein Triagg1_5075 [Trichoderma aggressivum f. europaeum]
MYEVVILYAVTTAMGTIPVSLLTVTMAAGTKEVLERHVIVRNLSSLEALDEVTAGDNFILVLIAIEEGRRIFENIRNFVLHVLAANLGFISPLTRLAFDIQHKRLRVSINPVKFISAPLRYGIFTPEFMLVFGILVAGCVLGSFTPPSSALATAIGPQTATTPVRPHATTPSMPTAYTAMTWISLLFSRELKDFR